MSDANVIPRPWTQPELNQAKLMHERGYPLWAIGYLLGRSVCAVKGKLFPSSQAFHLAEVRRLERERDARRAAADLRDTTALFFGDPPPGFTALDRRQFPNPSKENA